jgi:FecR protein
MNDRDKTAVSDADGLFLQAIDGDLAPAEHQEFSDRLEQSPAVLREFLDLHGEHRLLRQVHRGGDGVFVNRVMSRLHPLQDSSGHQPSAVVSPFWRSSSILAAAASAAALLLLLVRTVQPLAGDPVGRVESVTSGLQVGDDPGTVGMPIATGDMVLTDDLEDGQLRLVDGSTIGLSSGSAWIERKPDALIVHVVGGRVDAAVAPQVPGQRFSVVGKHATATVVGTRFTVWSDSDAMHVNVQEGVVQVTRNSDGKSVSLEAGQRVRVTSDPVLVVTSGRESGDPVAITEVSLIDAQHHQPIPAFTPLRDGATIDLADLPSASLNMLLSAKVDVADVRVTLEGGDTRIRRRDQFRPFTAFGNVQGLYKGWTPAVGTYQLTITPYGYDLQPGTVLPLTFTVVDSRIP